MNPRRTRAPLLLAAAALAAAPGLRADLLIQRSGAELQGSLTGLTADAVRFRPEGEDEQSLPRSEVTRLEVYRDLGGPPARRVEDLDDPVLREALETVDDPATYPSAGSVNLFYGRTVRFGSDWSRELTVRNVVRVLQERGKGEGTVQTDVVRDRDEFRMDFGRTVMPDGSLRRLTGKGARVAPKRAGEPEYDRQDRHLLTLPAVDVGRLVDWQYTVTSSGAFPELPTFYSDGIRLSEPVLRGRIEVRLHQDLEADVVLSQVDGVTRRRFVDGNERVERFEYLGLVPEPKESALPPSAELYPTVYVAPRKTWAEVAEPVRAAVESASEVGPLAAALLAEKVTSEMGPDEIYTALALWVAREVRLVGVPLHDVRYTPRSVEQILASRSGNYLDKTFVLHALLLEAGVPSELHLARDAYVARMPEGVRSLWLFNDAVVRVRLEGGWAYRCADDEDVAPDVLDEAFYGAPTLRVSGPAAPTELGEIPVPPPEADLVRGRYTTRLEPDGTLVGSRDLHVKGNSAQTVRSYRNLSGDALQKRMESLNNAFHPSAELVDFELEHLADFTKDPIYRRRFRVPGYALRAGGTLMAFRVPGLQHSAADVSATTRRHPMAFRGQTCQEIEADVVLPEGFRVLHLPEDLEVALPGFEYRGRFAHEDGVLRFRERYVRTATRLPAARYPAFKEMRDQRARLARQWVVIERTD